MAPLIENRLTHFATHMETPVSLPFGGGEVVIFTRAAPDKLGANEDALAVLHLGPMAGVLAVADGCGGESNGQEAARRAITALADAVMQCENPELLRASILDGFEAATRNVASLGNGAATTLIAVEVFGGLMRTYHVGDSQAMLIGGKGKLKLQTRAHSPVGYALEAGMLSEDAALEHEDRHLVSNVIGQAEMHIDLGLPRPFSKRDTLLIGSDGLYDNLTQAEIVQLVRKRPLLAAAEETCKTVAARMSGLDPNAPCKPDDLTMLIFRQ